MLAPDWSVSTMPAKSLAGEDYDDNGGGGGGGGGNAATSWSTPTTSDILTERTRAAVHERVSLIGPPTLHYVSPAHYKEEEEDED